MCREAKKMITHCETENALWQKTWTWSIMLCSTTHTWWIYLLDVGKVDKNDKTYARKCTTYINLSCLFQLQKNIQRTNMQRTLCKKNIAKTLHRKALANPKLIERNITEKKTTHFLGVHHYAKFISNKFASSLLLQNYLWQKLSTVLRCFHLL